jgi:ABC-type phosphate/phosphonate transport system substrate-binding protein
MNNVRRHCRTAIVALAAFHGTVGAQSIAQPETHVTFIGVSPDDDYQKADRKLGDILRREKRIVLIPQPNGNYGVAIQRLVLLQDPYLARMTPYACVAAQMLGAHFEILATYKSNATGGTTYHSYFVVNRKAFPGKPSLDNILEYLLQTQRTFMYTDKFSTSGYFLPSLYFHQKNIYAMTKSIGSLHPIKVDAVPEGKTGSYLVEQVAGGQLDIAAVWDGTKRKYETLPLSQEIGAKVYFVELPDALPNDLLVGSTGLSPKLKEDVHQAILSMKDHDIDIGDFNTWIDISKASEALDALDNLSQEAAAPLQRVIVSVQAAKGVSSSEPRIAQYLEAVRHALRLSGTEFAEFREHYHQRYDVTWEIQPIHDGAIRLVAEYMRGSGLEPQTFQISFTNAEDLTGRIVSLMRTQMHRIRYVWPYQELKPTVIRDVDFTYPRGAQLKVLKITWTDPDKNDFREEQAEFFDAAVEQSDAYKFQLAESSFGKRQDGRTYDFDPMSNTVYRVFLVRPSHEPLMFQVLTGMFLALLAGAAIWAVLDLRPERAHTQEETGTWTLDGACQKLVDSRLSPWRDKKVLEADLLWCDRPRIENYIEELKTSGVILPFDKTGRSTETRRFGLKAPLVEKLVEASVEMQLVRELHVDPSKVGDASRLSSLIPFLVQKGRISAFAGEPVEWEALDAIAARALESLNGNKPGQAVEDLLRPEHSLIVDLVSRHFKAVVQDGLERESLFCGTWRMAKQEAGGYRLSRTVDLAGRLELEPHNGAAQRLVLEFSVPGGTDLKAPEGSLEINAWILGKVVDRSYRNQGTVPDLWLEFRPLAVIKTNV